MLEGLFDVAALEPPAGSRPVGRVERAALASVSAAGLTTEDAAAAALAVELARAVDTAAVGKSAAYAVAAAGRELRETLIRLRLDPVARGGGVSDPLGELLERLATPE